MPNRPKDFSVTATAPASDDFLILDGATNSTRKLSALHLANTRNALAPRGGVAFDGTSGTKAKCSLTGQLIGADNFSVTLAFKVPTVNPASNAVLCEISSAIGAGDQANSVLAYIETSGRLRFLMYGDTTVANYRDTPSLNITSSHAGKVAHLVFGRNAAGLFCFINGVAQTFGTDATGGTQPTWATTSVTSTYFYVGHASGTIFAGTIYSATLYNLALTQADVTEIYELGGAVRERDKFGSQVARYTSDFSAGLDGFNAAGGGYATLTCSGNVDTSADGASIPPSDDWQRADQSGTGRITYYSNSSAGLAVYQKTMRITGSIFIPAGSTVTHMVVGFEVVNTTNEGYISTGGLGFIAGSVVALTPGSTTNFNVTAINTAAGSTRAIYFVASNSAGVAQNYTAQKVYVKNVVVRQVGAVCHLRLSDGIGRVLRDSSTNKLHALRTVAGVSDVIELDDGVVPYTTPSSANGPVIDTAGALRTDCVLVDVIVKNTTANAITGFGLGMASGVRDLTYDTDIPANATRILPIKRADLTGLTLGTAPYGLVYFSAASWNSGLVNIVIRYRRERDL